MSSTKLPARARDVRALELITEGKTYDEAARILGYTDGSSAYKAARRAVERREFAAADQFRYMHIERAQAFRRSLWPLLSIPERAARAVEVLVKVDEREAKLLGLDAPEPTPPPVVVTVVFEGGISIDDI